VLPRKGLTASPLCGFASGNPAGVTYGNNEELERKARFFAKQKMRPNDEKAKQTPPTVAYASAICDPKARSKILFGYVAA
jgi:hypothetical protein